MSARRHSFFVPCLQYLVGGTSAVAPMWAAWKALTDAAACATLPFAAEVRLKQGEAIPL